MLQIGDNILGGVLVRVVIDENTGKTQVFIPLLVPSPSTEPFAEFDPSVTIGVITAIVWLVLGHMVG